MNRRTNLMCTLVVTALVAVSATACSNASQDQTANGESAMLDETAADSTGSEASEASMTGGESHDEGGGEGEEGGVYIAKAATWDAVRRGARLVLSFNATSNTFTGTVENRGTTRMCDARAKVHLGEGGGELGPTPKVNLTPGQKSPIVLPSGGKAFSTWTAHPEVGACPN